MPPKVLYDEEEDCWDEKVDFECDDADDVELEKEATLVVHIGNQCLGLRVMLFCNMFCGSGKS